MFPKVFAIFGYQKVVNLHKRQPFGDARCVRKDKQAHRRTDRQKEGKMEICISIQKLRQTNKQTDGQTKRWKDSPGNNNIDSSPIWYYQLYTSQGNPKKSGQQTDKHTRSQAHYYIVLTHGSEQPILRWHTVMNCHCLWILLCNVTLLLTISICMNLTTANTCYLVKMNLISNIQRLALSF